MISSRRGAIGSGILFFVFFLMMAMIASGLAGGAYAFFGKGYDFREFESKPLFEEVKECFVDNNFFDKGFNENKTAFFETCDLSRETLEDGKHLVYVKRVSDNQEFFVGVYDYTLRCNFEARIKNRDLPLCKTETVGDYEIIVGSSQNSRRVSL
ncbi:MAG: hypothetical protein ACP5NS_02205 [Candidatus Pacearchaeota archaeon]